MACVIIPLFFNAKHYCVIGLYHILFILSPVEGMDTGLLPPFGYCEWRCYKHSNLFHFLLLVLLGIFLEVELLDHINPLLLFEEATDCFIQQLCHFMFPPATRRVPVSPHKNDCFFKYKTWIKILCYTFGSCIFSFLLTLPLFTEIKTTRTMIQGSV